ncbi:MAG: response regulator transcription factor [Lachnoclostridium sp.]|nr:response regulator transcription factor [Lachnoclostridium sp.]
MSDNSKGTVLIIDTDESIIGLLQNILTGDGYAVDTCQTAEQALVMRLESYRLIICEVDLDQIDGFEFVERIKDMPSTALIPVIFCSTRDGENDIITGLNAGADDYVVKPFSLREMLARIRSVMRRHRFTAPVAAPKVIEYKKLMIDLDAHSVSIAGEPISFTPTEFQIMSLLMKNRNKLVTREEIFMAAWPGENEVSKRTVDVNISRIRKKLGEYGANIVNRSGIGYGFID